MARQTTYQTTEESKFVDNKRTNTKSDLIEITQDKLENILLKNIKYLNIRSAWINPLSLFLTLLLAKLTADFKDFIGIPKYTWEAIFIIGNIISFIWLIATLARIIIYWDKLSMDNIINHIKNVQEDGTDNGKDNSA